MSKNSKTMKNVNWSAYVGIMIAMTVWSCSFLFTQEALKSFNPITVVTLRIGLATALLGLYGWVAGRLQKPRKQDVWLFLLGGAFQPFSYFMCETYGLSMTSATVTSVVMAMIPLFAPLVAWVLLRERVTWMNMAGIVVSMVGVMMLVVEKGDVNVSVEGLLVLMGAVMSAAMYSTILRKIPSEYTNVSIVFWVHASSLIFFIPTFLMLDLKNWGVQPVLPMSVVSIVVLAVFASVVSFVLFCYVVRRIGVTRANAFCNVMPAITALAVWMIYGEAIPMVKWIGIVVVIVGLFVSQGVGSKE